MGSSLCSLIAGQEPCAPDIPAGDPQLAVVDLVLSKPQGFRPTLVSVTE